MSILIVSGTGTEIGKTIVTAAVAALAAARGGGVAVVKPAQTGMAPGEPGDLAAVSRLAGVRDTHEYARYPDPLSPAAAARLSGLPALSLGQVASDIRKLSEDRALVLVEGAGGLLVRYDEEGATLADLARDLGAPVLVVADPRLGTLNHTALTLESWPRAESTSRAWCWAAGRPRNPARFRIWRCAATCATWRRWRHARWPERWPPAPADSRHRSSCSRHGAGSGRRSAARSTRRASARPGASDM